MSGIGDLWDAPLRRIERLGAATIRRQAELYGSVDTDVALGYEPPTAAAPMYCAIDEATLDGRPVPLRTLHGSRTVVAAAGVLSDPEEADETPADVLLTRVLRAVACGLTLEALGVLVAGGCEALTAGLRATES